MDRDKLCLNIVWRSVRAVKESSEHRHRWDLAMYESVLAAGRGALQASMTINGAAAVALLAYCGNLAKDGHVPPARIAYGMFVFSLGVFFAALAYGVLYVAQSAYSAEHYGNSKKWPTGAFWNRLTIALVAGSYVAFLVGSTLAMAAMF